MRLSYWTSTLALCALGCAPPAATSSPPSAPPPATSSPPRVASSPPTGQLTTKSGVFTSAQASRGGDTYAGMCTGCHSASQHTGSGFMNPWVGLPLVDLFVYLRESMPKSDPGSLSAQEYADVIAYMLSINGMPPGSNPLPGDTTTLRKIRIEPAVENDRSR